MKIKTTLLVLFLLLYCRTINSKERPNVIMILADDLGSGDLHCTGHPYAKTPNLDNLADDGIRFGRAYMAAPWSAPSRYALMSGKYPARYFDNTLTIRPEEPTVTKILKDSGYKTAHIGKWHLSARQEGAVTPDELGIDHHFLTSPAGNSRTWTKEERDQEYWRAKTTDAYVDMTIDFIKKNSSRDSSDPFYINLWIYPTHSYIHPTPEQLAVYKDLKVNFSDFSPYQQEFLKFVSQYGDINKSMQAYCADITAMDNALGRLFDFLKKNNLFDNTLIVFTSDNGPGPLTKQIESKSIGARYKEEPDLLNSVGSAKIYKERKLSLHEGGLRVPFIVSWPKHVPSGKIDEKTVIHGTDWLPTIAAICEAKIPEGIYDGINVENAFYGKEFQRKEALFWTQEESVGTLQGNWKGIMEKGRVAELYDIIKDPLEKNNLKANFPETASKMEKQISDWKMNIKEPETEKKIKNTKKIKR